MSKSKDLNPIERLLGQWAMEANGEALLPCHDPEFSASFPNLWMLLTWRAVGDFERAPGSLTVSADGAAWKLSYYDPSAKRRASVAGATRERLRRHHRIRVVRARGELKNNNATHQ